MAGRAVVRGRERETDRGDCVWGRVWVLYTTEGPAAAEEGEAAGCALPNWVGG